MQAAPTFRLMPDRVLPPVRTPFRAIARVVVPEMAEMDAMAWEEAEAIIEAGVRDRPAAMKRQLRLFIRVIQLLPIFRYGRPFTRLSPGQGEKVLRWLEGSWGIVQEALEHLVRSHPDHRLVGTGHSDIGLEGGALRQDSLVGGRDVGVGPEHRAHSTIEVPSHRLLLARCLGMKVHNDQVR